MNPFKRIAITLNASVDQFLEQVENHEALAESSIRDVEKAAQQAQRHCRRIRAGHLRLENRLEELRREKEAWTGRARKLHEQRPADALECVRRLKLLQGEEARIETQKAEYREIEAELTRDLREIEAKLGELRLKRSRLATRQARSDARHAIDRVDSGAEGLAEGVFERWEASIERKAGFADSFAAEGPLPDALEAGLVREEERAELEKALQELVGGSEN